MDLVVSAGGRRGLSVRRAWRMDRGPVQRRPVERDVARVESVDGLLVVTRRDPTGRAAHLDVGDGSSWTAVAVPTEALTRPGA